MQVILMDDVERVGHEGDVIAVADGFARNYLIPRGLAVQATRGALRDLERRRKAISSREDVKRDKAADIAAQLGGRTVVVKARAGQGERLHGQVTPQMIAQAAQEQLHMDIDRREIDIPEPIRELGDYLVRTRLYKEVYAQLPVSVVRDLEAEQQEAEEAGITAAADAEEAAAEEAVEEAPEAEEAVEEAAEEGELLQDAPEEAAEEDELLQDASEDAAEDKPAEG